MQALRNRLVTGAGEAADNRGCLLPSDCGLAGSDPARGYGISVSQAGGFRCEVLGGGDSGKYTSVTREPWLGGEAEQLADKVSLADRISFGQPSHSALPDHVHCFDSLQRSPRTLKGSTALGQPNSFFNRPVVLFNHVIEIFALA